MRIALCSDCFWPRVNGVTVAVQTLKDELRKLGHEVLLVVPDYPPTISLPRHDDSGVYRVSARRSCVSREDYLADRRGQRQAARLLRDFDPDIIHAHTEFALSRVAARCARDLGRPFVMTSHTFFEQYISHYIPFLPGILGSMVSRLITYRKFRHANVILTPGSDMVRTLRGYGLGQPIVRMPTGIDTGLYHDLPQDRHLRLPPTLLFVGRVAQEKNVLFLLDVLERVRRQVSETHLRIVGSGPAEQELMERARRRGLGAAVTLVGYLPREQVIREYAAADVFVFPSLTETQGLVSIEALLAGTPVVAIAARGSAEFLRNGEGALLTAADPEVFAAAVLRLLEPETWSDMSRRARRYGSNFTAEALARQTEALYRDLVSSRSRPGPNRSGRGRAPRGPV